MKPISKAAQKRNDIEEAKAMLRELFPKGSNVCTIVRKVSPSGMSRQISVIGLILEMDQKLHDPYGREFQFRHPNHAVALVTGRRLNGPNNRNDAIIVNGCGMDMQYALVSDLSHALYGHDGMLKVVKL
jgi:hypothetical protein